MFIRKHEDDVEIYNDSMELVGVFGDADYFHRNGKYYIHSAKSEFKVFVEMPEQMTAVIYILPKQ